MKRSLIIFLCLFLFSGPVTAQNLDIQKVISDQIEAFQKDDSEGAFDFAAPTIKNIFGNHRRFAEMVQRGYPMVFRPKGFSFRESQSDDTTAQQDVLIEDQSTDLHLLRYTLVLLDGEWKISGVEILRTSIVAT
jgi:hypothetical protein